MAAVLIIVFGALIALVVVGSSNPALGGILVSDKVKSIAQAIADAEGFNADPSNLPTRTHNPGDLKLGDVGNGTEGGKTVFASDADGWAALYKQVNLMVTGQSAFYKPSDSWRRIAQTYVGTSDYVNWLNSVTDDLGVMPDSTLQEYMDS